MPLPQTGGRGGPQGSLSVHLSEHRLSGLPLSSPSSHSSGHSVMPLPQTAPTHLHFLSQRQPLEPFLSPSSHSSPGCRMPSPHLPQGMLTVVQLAEHFAPGAPFSFQPRSHSS